MEFDSDLNKLEQNVERLLNNLDSVQGDKSSLLSDLDKLREEKAALEEEVARLKEEKTMILSRVNTLIGNIEKWEGASDNSSEEEENETTVPANDTPADPVQGVLLGNG